jgi:tetrahydromethanopterin S-methyltransferase subunit D
MNESAGFDQPGTSGSSAAIRPPPQIPAAALRRRENCSMLMITGQIDAVELISVPNVYCKYSFVYGLDWKQVAGSEEGRMWCHPN